jgi:acetylornithine deacetylase/succinyl-diaminopimelate desuccinylase-like protein
VGAFPASTDAPHFLCPAVVCGPGSINQAHTLDEYVSIDELCASARIYLRTVLNMIS